MAKNMDAKKPMDDEDGTLQGSSKLAALRSFLNKTGNLGDDAKGLQMVANEAAGQAPTNVGEEDKSQPHMPEINVDVKPQNMASGGLVSGLANAFGDLSQMGGGNPIPFLQDVAPYAQKVISPEIAMAKNAIASPQPSADGSVDLSQLPQPPQAPAPTPQSAPMPSHILKQAQATPPTNYDFYGDVNSDKVAQLYKHLLANQQSAGSIAGNAVAGLGDAISRSYGHQNTNYQKDFTDRQNQVMQQQLGQPMMERENKLQDMQANTEMGLNDPHSTVSQSMRKAFQSAGINVPSGMPGSLMLKIAPDMGNFALKQAMMGQTGHFKQAEIDAKQAAINEQKHRDFLEHPFTSALEQYASGQSSPANPYADELAKRKKGA